MNLIERYGLASRVPLSSTVKGKEKEVDGLETGASLGGSSGPGMDGDSSSSTIPLSAGGSPGARPGGGAGQVGKWEDTRKAREKGLRERKEKMILEARK